MSEDKSYVSHPLAPIYDRNSRILILGTMPSVVSRREGFYYAHPQNRFWHVLGELLGEPTPAGNDGKRDLLLRHDIALWDVLQGCRIEGSSDASIRNAVPNDLSPILRAAPIQAIYCNGGTAYRIYQKSCTDLYALPCVGLPSTSPANARMNLAQLCEAWRAVAVELR